MYDAKVKRGVKLLDEHAHNWWTTINPEILDMGSTCHCILGQTFGGYTRGLDALFGENNYHSQDEGSRYGYDTGSEDSDGTKGYKNLRSAWVRAIKARYLAGAKEMK